tara:strand:+ start:149 stop:847 length:699 start_codon:yes stop_codon:yes gene_type:complete
MSSPFQKKMMGKSPINQLRTAQMITKAAQAADEEFYKDIDPYEAEGNRMEAEQQSKVLPIDDKTSYEYDYDQNPETTAKKKSPLNSNSPLHGAYAAGAGGGKYISTLPGIREMQDSIGNAVVGLKGLKADREFNEDLEKSLSTDEYDAGVEDKVIGDPGFGSDTPPLDIEDINVLTEEDADVEYEQDEYARMKGYQDVATDKMKSNNYGLTNKSSLESRILGMLKPKGGFRI